MKRVSAIIIALLIVPQVAPAQTLPVTPPSLSELLGDEATLSLIPSLGWIQPGARSALDARLFWPGRVDRDVFMQLGLELGGARFDLQSYLRTGVDVRVVRRWQTFSPWLGAAVSAGSGAGPRQFYQLSVGGEAGMFGAAVRTSWFEEVWQTRDSLRPATAVTVQQRHTDAELTATRRLGPFLTSLTAGRRFGGYHSERNWAFATLTIPVRSRVGISLASGWRPEQTERAQPGGAFAQIALRFDVRSSDPRRTVPAAPGEEEWSLNAVATTKGYQLRVKASHAQSVELKGDLSDWEILHFQRAANGVWELQVDVPAGVYKINIRIDGQEWIVPLGMVAIADGFGSTAGVLNLH
jgi:hypothetical protein